MVSLLPVTLPSLKADRQWERGRSHPAPWNGAGLPTPTLIMAKRGEAELIIIFQATIGNFNRTRLAMDGHYSDKTLDIAPRSHNAGFNSVLFTTHRQNYLVPPRRHRSFPLAEFLT